MFGACAVTLSGVDTAELVLEYVRALAWPVVVLIALALMRHQLRGVLHRLTGVEGFGVKASLSEAVIEARAISGTPRQTKPVKVPAGIEPMRPRSYSDAGDIGRRYRAGETLLVNLEDASNDDAKRIIDFIAGLVFHDHGQIERVSSMLFLLTPVNPER